MVCHDAHDRSPAVRDRSTPRREPWGLLERICSRRSFGAGANRLRHALGKRSRGATPSGSRTHAPRPFAEPLHDSGSPSAAARSTHYPSRSRDRLRKHARDVACEHSHRHELRRVAFVNSFSTGVHRSNRSRRTAAPTAHPAGRESQHPWGVFLAQCAREDAAQRRESGVRGPRAVSPVQETARPWRGTCLL
jgi:hypothetical protein